MSDSEEEEIVAVPGQQLAGRKRRRTNAARLEAPCWNAPNIPS